ncbi:MAG: hypothetical protein AB8B56_03565 [Crocinitomicaceae bacterium]
MLKILNPQVLIFIHDLTMSGFLKMASQFVDSQGLTLPTEETFFLKTEGTERAALLKTSNKSTDRYCKIIQLTDECCTLRENK